jgi:hypothetical protein
MDDLSINPTLLLFIIIMKIELFFLSLRAPATTGQPTLRPKSGRGNLHNTDCTIYLGIATSLRSSQ